jgi:hypothetical protein
VLLSLPFPQLLLLNFPEGGRMAGLTVHRHEPGRRVGRHVRGMRWLLHVHTHFGRLEQTHHHATQRGRCELRLTS